MPRVLVVDADPEAETSGLDAEIRVGGDAGASDVVILWCQGANAHAGEPLVAALLLPDAPIVVWWPGAPPEVPADTPLGRLAHRRITDSATCPDAEAALRSLA